MPKVLIVDDSKTIRILVKKVLIEEKIIISNANDILEANDGQELINVFLENSDIEYILADINMPNQKGDVAINYLRNHGWLTNKKVIFITTENIHLQDLQYANQSIIGLIKKPINMETLSLGLKRVLKEKNSIQNPDQDGLNFQKKLLKKVSKEYYSKLNIDEEFDSEIFSNILNAYVGQKIFKEDELLTLSVNIFNDYCKSCDLSIRAEANKYSFIFNSIQAEIAESQNSLKIKQYSVEEMLPYINGDKALDLDHQLLDTVNDCFGHYAQIVDGINKHIKKDYIEFINKLDTENTDLFIKLFETVTNVFSNLDYAIESFEIKQYIKYLKLLKIYNQTIIDLQYGSSGSFNIVASMYQGKYAFAKEYILTLEQTVPEFVSISQAIQKFNETYQNDYYEILKQNMFDIKITDIEKGYKYYIYMLYTKIFEVVKNSTFIQRFYLSRKNCGRFSLKSLIYFMLANNLIQTERVDFQNLFDRLENEPLSVVFLTDEALDEKDSIVPELEANIKKIGSNWKFFAFNRNNIFALWLKTHTPNIVMIDYDYDKTEEFRFMNLYEGNEKLKSNVSFILSVGQNMQVDNKKIMGLCSAFIKKPLTYDKVVKAFTFL